MKDCLSVCTSPNLVDRVCKLLFRLAENSWLVGLLPTETVIEVSDAPYTSLCGMRRITFSPRDRYVLTSTFVLRQLLGRIKNFLSMKKGKQMLRRCVVSAKEKADDQVLLIEMLLKDHGATRVIPEWLLNETLVRFILLNLLDLTESYLKWKFNHIAALCLRGDEDCPHRLPERPKFVTPEERGDALLGSNVFRYIRKRIFVRDHSFGIVCTQAKKGLPVVSDELVRASVEKTVKGLTSVPVGFEPRGVLREEFGDTIPEPHFDADWQKKDREPQHTLTIEALVAQVVRTSREAFGRGWYRASQPVYTPSISGHFYVGRGGSGALGALVRNRKPADVCQLPWRDPRIAREFSIPTPKNTTTTPDRWGVDLLNYEAYMTATERFRADFLHCSCCRKDFPEKVRFCDACGWEPSDYLLEVPVSGGMSNILLEAREYDSANAHCRLNCVRPVGLKEPCKVRVITGGPEGKYYLSKYIQKAVHGHLRKKPYGRLIGEVITDAALLTQLRHPRPGQFYVSGDYSSATDMLHPALSEAAATTIASMAGWDAEWTKIFVDTLVNHRIYAEKGKPSTDENELRSSSLPQMWGQLMGSPTSFPVLCLVNLALSRYALELREECKISLEESGILINGDDIGFVTDKTGYEMWEKVTTAGGLSPSPGKNYCSKEFIVLNSTFFKVGLGENDERSFEVAPYINYGLMMARNDNGTPIHKLDMSLVQSGDPRTPDIGALAHDLIKGHPVDLQVSLLKRFIKYWAPSLKQFCPFGMSYFLPRHLGGLGLPIVGEFKSRDGKSRFSRCQLKMAAFLSHSPDLQELLISSTMISRSEKLSMWKLIRSKMDELLNRVPSQWVREGDVIDGVVVDTKILESSRALTVPLLASAYADLTPSEVPEEGEDDEGDRYHEWKDQFEELFDLARRSTYHPLSEEEISTNLPYQRIFDSFTVVDPSPRVDLRLPISQLTYNWANPQTTRVAGFDAPSEEEQC